MLWFWFQGGILNSSVGIGRSRRYARNTKNIPGHTSGNSVGMKGHNAHKNQAQACIQRAEIFTSIELKSKDSKNLVPEQLVYTPPDTIALKHANVQRVLYL